MGIEACERRPRTVAAGVLFVLFSALAIASCRSPAGGVAASRDSGVLMPGEPDVRVRVKASLAQTKLTGPKKFRVEALGSSGPAGPRLDLPAPLTVSGTVDGLRVTDGKGANHDFPGPAGVQIAGDNPDEDPKLRIRVDGTIYPGKLRLLPRQPSESKPERPVSDATPAMLMGPIGEDGAPVGAVVASAQPPRAGKSGPAPAASKTGTKPALRFDVIEIVGIETYLTGVVPSEMFPDWPLAAFQVQAVAARTYAMHERQRSIALNQDFDLEATTYDQAYGGASSVTTAAKAVESTRGVVLTWEGGLLRAYYSSTCGGRTASAADVWPTGKGYEFNRALPLQSKHRDHACESTKWYRWEVTRDRLELSRRLRAWGEKAGESIKRLEVVEKIEPVKRNADGRPSRYRVTDERGRGYDVSAEELRVACNTGVAGLPEISNTSPVNGRVRSGDLEVEFDGAKVMIRGRGFGHGVGMCQYCAKVFAERGEPWQTNVVRFYPGAKLERAY